MIIIFSPDSFLTFFFPTLKKGKKQQHVCQPQKLSQLPWVSDLKKKAEKTITYMILQHEK